MTPIDEKILGEIQARLDAVEAEHGVRILFAVESGSRAWGFPSPDSDYDVRFVYVHEPDRYLSLAPVRDVIETPIEGVFDVNGWDLRKALQLLIKPNPVLLEWLDSPLRYRGDEAALTALRALAGETLHRRPATHHYLHLGEGQWRRYIEGRTRVPLKKYFYVLRPALALRWLRLHPDRRPPMDIAALRAGTDLPPGVDEFIGTLIERKKATRELGDGPRQAALDELILHELDAARRTRFPDELPQTALPEKADEVFRHLVKTAGPAGV